MPLLTQLQSTSDPQGQGVISGGQQSYFAAGSPLYAEYQFTGGDAGDVSSSDLPGSPKYIYALGKTLFGMEISGASGGAAYTVVLEASISGAKWNTLVTLDYNTFTGTTIWRYVDATAATIPILPRLLRIRVVGPTNAAAIVRITLVGTGR